MHVWRCCSIWWIRAENMRTTQASQLGLAAFIRPVQADALGSVDLSLTQNQTDSQEHQMDAMPAKRQQQLAARKSVANVLEQLDDIMQVCALDHNTAHCTGCH